ncbi:MAG: adenine deaminase C-terminal domain-containing protein, partial [Desulfohalobiaceae bacterium]
AVLDGQVLESLPLPVAGLMSDQRLEAVVDQLQRLETASRTLGTPIPGLFMILSFLALPVIPALKLTDLGLVDVNAFDFTPLWTDTP